MSVKEVLLHVGFDKNGEFDFGVRCDVTELSYEKMTQFRAMITVAIGTMEQMWRDEQAKAEQVGAQRESPK